LNLIDRIIQVRRAVGVVLKTASIDGQYMAVTHDAVTRACRDAMNEAGLVLFISVASENVKDIGIHESGFPIIRYEAKYFCSITCAADDGNEGKQDQVDFYVTAHALDSGDKAPGKALSYAYKYAMLKLFMIETGENDEQRLENVTTVPATMEDLDKLHKIIAQHYPSPKSEAVYARIYEKYNVSSVNALTSTQVGALISSIEAANASTNT
jgi:hypothetical protein